MPPFNYSDAPPPRDLESIPQGTIATCILHIRPGNVGEDGLLTRNKDGTCEMLNCEFVIADGLYKGRKFWEYLVMEGTTPGHAQSIDINRGTLKAILDSALGLDPEDKSPKAQAARTVSYKDFEGKTFMAKSASRRAGRKRTRPGSSPARNGRTKISSRE